ncbi:hypothetical protein ACFQ2B_27950 [Streptomyces stramineus]
MAPRTATDDQPFDFNLDAVKAEVDLTPGASTGTAGAGSSPTCRAWTCGP